MRRRRTTPALDIPRSFYVWLLWNDFDAAIEAADAEGGEGIKEIYFASHAELERAWQAIEPEAVAEWIESYPGTRPPRWWYHSAPELRRLEGGEFGHISGAARCHPTGCPYINEWQADPPIVESQAAYLDRFDLWLPGERARVLKAAFAARRFSFDLTWAPNAPDGEL
jgi:hypothetical protein